MFLNPYWLTLTEDTTLFSGVKKFFSYLESTNQPIFLVTGSDARLKMNKDGQFIYDPQYSENFKRKRISLLKNKGLNYRSVSIGDPEDKPSLDFFKKAINTAEEDLGEKLNYDQCVMVGDSYDGDLATPYKKIGFGLVVLFVKGQSQVKAEGKRFVSTGDLNDLSNYLV